MRLGFPLRELLGGDVLEYKAIDTIEDMLIDGAALPAYQWKGILQPTKANVLANNGQGIEATRNTLGKGTVYWIPSLVGLGSRIQNDYSQLNNFLANALGYRNSNHFLFDKPQKGLLMKTLRLGKEVATIMVNKSKERKEFKMHTPQTANKQTVLFNNKGGSITGNQISIDTEETLVIKWD